MIWKIIFLFIIPLCFVYPQTLNELQQYKLKYVDKNNINNITNFYQRCYSKGGKVPSQKKNMISFDNTGINSITGIYQFDETPAIFLRRNPITNIDELKYLVNLEILWLDSTDISSISSLEKLEKLEELVITNTRIKKVSNLPLGVNKLYVDDDIEDLDLFLQKRKDCKVFRTRDRDPDSINPNIKCKVLLDDEYKKYGKGCLNNKKNNCRKPLRQLQDPMTRCKNR